MKSPVLVVVTVATVFVSAFLAHCNANTVQIFPASNTAYCLTGPPNNIDQQPFTLAACTGITAQKYGVSAGAFGDVQRIITGHTAGGCTNKCLDVPAGAGTQTKINQTSCDIGNRNQWWTVPAVTSGLVSGIWLKNVGTGQCATAENPNLVDNFDCSPGALHQIWDYGSESLVSGAYNIRNKGALYLLSCLDIKGASTDEDAILDIPLCSSGAYNQQFVFDMISPWKVSLASNGKCLDGGGSAGPAYQYTCSPSALNHQWFRTRYPDEPNAPGYYIVDLLSGMCLTWPSSLSGTVTVSTCVKGNVYQQWLDQAQ